MTIEEKKSKVRELVARFREMEIKAAKKEFQASDVAETFKDADETVAEIERYREFLANDEDYEGGFVDLSPELLARLPKQLSTVSILIIPPWEFDDKLTDEEFARRYDSLYDEAEGRMADPEELLENFCIQALCLRNRTDEYPRQFRIFKSLNEMCRMGASVMRECENRELAKRWIELGEAVAEVNNSYRLALSEERARALTDELRRLARETTLELKYQGLPAVEELKRQE